MVKVNIKKVDNLLELEGTLGLVKRKFSGKDILFGGDSLLIKSKQNLKTFLAIFNMLKDGVENGYFLNIKLEGRGYRLLVLGNKIYFKFSSTNYKCFEIPKGLIVLGSRQNLVIFGLDKDQVNGVGSLIKKLKLVEPYKGKGILYVGEDIELKVGKQK